MNDWQMTDAERTEAMIQKAVKAGVSLSRHCRNVWTGERTSPCIKAERITHWHILVSLAINGRGDPLLDFADVADLDKIIYLGRADQHQWDAARWEQELRAKW